MKTIKMLGHWTPIGFHGIIPYVEGQDIAQLVGNKLKTLLPEKHYISLKYDTILYMPEMVNEKNVLVFEVR